MSFDKFALGLVGALQQAQDRDMRQQEMEKANKYLEYQIANANAGRDLQKQGLDLQLRAQERADRLEELKMPLINAQVELAKQQAENLKSQIAKRAQAGTGGGGITGDDLFQLFGNSPWKKTAPAPTPAAPPAGSTGEAAPSSLPVAFESPAQQTAGLPVQNAFTLADSGGTASDAPQGMGKGGAPVFPIVSNPAATAETERVLSGKRSMAGDFDALNQEFSALEDRAAKLAGGNKTKFNQFRAVLTKEYGNRAAAIRAHWKEAQGEEKDRYERDKYGAEQRDKRLTRIGQLANDATYEEVPDAIMPEEKAAKITRNKILANDVAAIVEALDTEWNYDARQLREVTTNAAARYKRMIETGVPPEEARSRVTRDMMTSTGGGGKKATPGGANPLESFDGAAVTKGLPYKNPLENFDDADAVRAKEPKVPGDPVSPDDLVLPGGDGIVTPTKGLPVPAPRAPQIKRGQDVYKSPMAQAMERGVAPLTDAIGRIPARLSENVAQPLSNMGGKVQEFLAFFFKSKPETQAMILRKYPELQQMIEQQMAGRGR